MVALHALPAEAKDTAVFIDRFDKLWSIALPSQFDPTTSLCLSHQIIPHTKPQGGTHRGRGGKAGLTTAGGKALRQRWHSRKPAGMG